ncbi:MAG: hypothetical protein HN348_30865 [Proteobacteria bacterium]|nr:hypothetical protein [Pseudomonadota bacterium]
MHLVLALEKMVADPDIRRTIPPIITTSIDLDHQKAIQEILSDKVESWEERGAGNAAAVVVDLSTNKVVASVGSTGWHDTRFAGAIDYTRTRRYPGSTLKPFIYGLALDQELIQPNTILDDLSRSRDGVGNADDRFLGPLLVRQALANSRNVPAVELMEQVGLDEGYAWFRELGLHEDQLPPSHYGMGLAIGGMPVRLIDLVEAYTVIAGDGTLRPLQWYDGQELPPSRQMLSEASARQIALFLSDPMARLPSFPRMGYAEYDFPVATKTGTSPDFRDAWAVVFSEHYLIGVWVGHPDYRPMQGLSGYRGGAQLAQTILETLHHDEHGLGDGRFPSPPDHQPMQICTLSGQLATENCDRAVSEWFTPHNRPVHDCNRHVRVGDRTYVDLPGRYAAWAKKSGLERLSKTNDPFADPEVAILSPRDGELVMSDPEAPTGTSTLLLQAEVSADVEQLVWYVDGAPYEVVEHPFVARWAISGGRHRIEARVPFRDISSSPVLVIAEDNNADPAPMHHRPRTRM